MGQHYDALKAIHANPGQQVLQGDTGHGGVPEPTQVPMIPPDTNMNGVKIGNGGNPKDPVNCVPSMANEPRLKGNNAKDY